MEVEEMLKRSEEIIAEAKKAEGSLEDLGTQMDAQFDRLRAAFNDDELDDEAGILLGAVAIDSLSDWAEIQAVVAEALAEDVNFSGDISQLAAASAGEAAKKKRRPMTQV